MRQGTVQVETLQHVIHEQTAQLSKLNHQLQEEIYKRQLLEEKLRTSEAKIRAVFEAMTDIVLVLNTQGNQIKDIEVIPTFANHLYESGTDLIDKTVKEFFQDKTAKTWFQKVREVLDNKQTLNFDYSLSIKGREVWFSASISPISDQSVVWVARDISEQQAALRDRKRGEEELRHSEERWQLVIQGNNDGVWDLNLNTNKVFRSARFAQMLGYEAHEIGDDNEAWSRGIHPDDFDRVMQANQDYLERKIPFYAVEYRLRCKDGSYKWILGKAQAIWDEAGNPVRMVGTTSDISDRKLAEEALHQSEERFRVLVESAPVGIFQTDLMGDCLFVNPRWLRITELSREEAIGIGWEKVLHPDECESVFTEWYDAAALGREFAMECRFITPQGTVKWVFVTAVPLRDGQRAITGYLGTVKDISDRKLAEERLKKSEASLAFAQRVARVGNWEFDVLTQQIAWSEEMFYIHGLDPTRPEPTLAEHVEQIHPEDRALWHRIVSHALESGEADKFDFRIVRSNGQVRHVEARGKAIVNEAGQVIQLFGTVMDITDRKLAEEQLRWQEALMRSMTSVSPLAFFVVDNRTDAILYFNRRFCEIWGIEHLEERMQRGELKNNDIIPDCLPSLADVPAFAQSYKPLQSEENRVVVEDEIPFVDGHTIRRFSTQVCDCENRYFGRLYIFEDITHRKIAEEALRQSEAREREKAQALERVVSELKRTQSQLIQVEKMSSLGQMVAGIAHEINNPTSFIYGNINPATEYTQDLLHLIELYRQHYPEPVAEITKQLELIEPDFIADDFPKLLASIKEGAQRIKQIVLSLRNFSRLDESESKRVDIHEGIDNTLLILKHRLKQQPKRPKIRVINEYGQLPKIECYPGQLNQVFMNIISNAIDALDEAIEKGTSFEPKIRIYTEVIKSDSRSSHSNDRSVSQVLIRIRDNSPSSIKAELLPKIFDPFFTTKPVGSGTGLGLSISYQIVVDRHRGQLSCYSTPGVGTEFAIELPIAQSATSHPT